MVITTPLLNAVLAGAVTSINTDATHIAVSTDNTTPTVSDTSLGGTELREAVFESNTTANSVSKSIFLDVTEFNGNTILKTGMYDAPSGGNLLSSSLTNTIPKDSNKEVFVEVTTTVNVVNI